MNYLQYVKELRNTYYALRHGQSIGNILKIFIGDPAVAVQGFGLTINGLNQARQRADAIEDFDGETVLYSSPFLRARETAEIIRWRKGIRQLHVDQRLRERSFGKLELDSDLRLREVYAHDKTFPYQSYRDVESLASIQDRVTSLVRDIEARHQGKRVILISHGCPLGVLLTSFQKLPLHRHVEHKWFQNAELRLIPFANGK